MLAIRFSLERTHLTFCDGLQARSSIGFHVARKPPWKFQPAFLFFCCCARSCDVGHRRHKKTCGYLGFTLFATVRAWASGNEQRVRQTGGTGVVFTRRSWGGPVRWTCWTAAKRWLPRAHSNRALYFWCTLQPPQVRVWDDVRFLCFSSNFFENQCESAKKQTNHQKINTVLQQRKHESLMVVSLTSLILFQDFMKVSTFWCGLPSHSQREKYCLITWPERKQHSTVCKQQSICFAFCLKLQTGFLSPWSTRRAANSRHHCFRSIPGLCILHKMMEASVCLVFSSLHSKKSWTTRLLTPQNWTQATGKSRCDDLISFALTERWMIL